MKTKLKIDGMHCTSCAMSIDERLEEIEGVFSASTSFPKGQTKIKFDERSVDVAALQQAISELGYEVRPKDG